MIVLDGCGGEGDSVRRVVMEKVIVLHGCGGEGNFVIWVSVGKVIVLDGCGGKGEFFRRVAVGKVTEIDACKTGKRQRSSGYLKYSIVTKMETCETSHSRK